MALKRDKPGVFINEIPSFPPSVVTVETAIPAFIGYTQEQKHLTDKEIAAGLIKPIRITSLIEYERYFGVAKSEEGISVNTKRAVGGPVATVDLDATRLSNFKMYYSLQFYFANGGGPCFIVSIGNYETRGGNILLDDLKNGLAESDKMDEVTLILFPDAQALPTAGDYYDLHSAALASCGELMDRFVIMDVFRADQKEIVDATTAAEPDKTPIAILRSKIGTARLMYGAAYYPHVDTSLDLAIDESKVTADGQPLIVIKEHNNKLYLQAISAIRDKPIRLGPSAGIAGVYASTDTTSGVWNAPANINMNLVIQPSRLISDNEQGGLNVDPVAGKSINVIRSFPGRGPGMVWGARTLAGNDSDWRYIPVRRFCMMVEESVKNACLQFVFEPNDASTWVRVQAMIENFLVQQWREGALLGAKPDDAFFVAVGLNRTMTAQDILEGRMIVQIGMAVVHPAEFIVLNFSQMMAQS